MCTRPDGALMMSDELAAAMPQAWPGAEPVQDEGPSYRQVMDRRARRGSVLGVGIGRRTGHDLVVWEDGEVAFAFTPACYEAA